MKNSILINPFQKIAGEKALFIGLVACLAQVLLGYFFQTHFDGILDAHYGKVESLVDSMSEMLINHLLPVFSLLESIDIDTFW